VEGVVSKNLLKYLENIGLTNKHLESGAQGRTVTNMQIPRTCPLNLRGWGEFPFPD
jgi:hypothetical protein